MGISNRDYYRESSSDGGGHFSAHSPDGMLKTLIVLCVVVFLGQVFTSTPNDFGILAGGLTSLFSLGDAELREFQLWRLITYGFCHGSVSHLVFNMLGLWIFGRMVEGVIGSRETLFFYLGGVVASGLCHVGASHWQGLNAGVVGASGGIYALTILAAFYYPRQRMYLFMLPIAIELRWMAMIYVLMDLFGGFHPGSSNVAHFAHLGGAAFGAIYHNFNWRFSGGRRNWGEIWSAPKRAAQAVKQSVGAGERPSVRLYAPPEDSELDRELDRILEKINREGKASLTPAENAFLLHASEQMRNRR